MHDWPIALLSDVVTFKKGKKVTTYSNHIPGRLPYLGASSIEGRVDEYAHSHDAVVASDKNVLMLWDGERSGLVGRGLTGVVGSTVCRLEAKSVITPGFLFHALRRNYKWIQARRTGTGIPHVPKDIGNLLKFGVPHLDEQRSIAEILDAADEVIVRAEQLIAKLQLVKQGLLCDLLTRGIDGHGDLRDAAKHPEQFKDSNIGRIPKAWEVCSARTLCTLITKGTTPPPGSFSSERGDVRYLRVDNLSQDGRLDLSPTPLFVSQLIHQGFLSRSKLFPNDVLMNIVGPPMGKTAIIPTESIDWNVNQAIAIFRTGEELLPQYFHLWLGGDFSRRWLRQRAKQTSGQVNLTLELCSDLPVALPSKVEQGAIVTAMKTASERIESERAALEKVQAYKYGLMDDLLTGRVRVPLDTKATA